MKKKDSGTMYDLDLSDISDTKANIEQNLPDFIRFREEDRQPIRRVADKKVESTNQTWSIPGRTYTWFPYFKMYLTSK